LLVRVEKVRPPRDKARNGKEEGSACMRSYVVRFGGDGGGGEGGHQEVIDVGWLISWLID
jgi:hypothetical protein